MGKSVLVGMADLNICKAPDSITTLGLGSCVGIAIRDPGTKIGGLAHIMLPDSKEISSVTHVPKFADTGIDELVKKVTAAGANRKTLVAKIAGGAQMFASNTNSNTLKVGARNVIAVKKKLQELGIRLLAEDTGDTYGRTVIFYPETGDYVIKTVGKPEKVI